MKRKMDWDDKEESGKEDNSTSDEESDDEEPRIKDVLDNLSNALFRKDASELLHSIEISYFGHLVDYYSETSAKYQ